MVRVTKVKSHVRRTKGGGKTVVKEHRRRISIRKDKLESLIKQNLRKIKEKYEDWENAILDAFYFADDSYVLTHYSSFPDGRGGDILAVHFKLGDKYYCVEIYDENTINLVEIDKETYEEDRPW